MARAPVFTVGLTGTIASGKEEVATLFVEAGFAFFSLSDRVKEEAALRGFQRPSRADLQRIGNELRGTFGPAVWAERTYEKIIDAAVRDAVVDGFRNPAEVAHFQQRARFCLVAVDASIEVRFKRLLERGRPGDPTTLAEFSQIDARDRGIGEPAEGQHVGACLQLAQFTILNDGTLAELRANFEALLREFKGGPYVRARCQ